MQLYISDGHLRRTQGVGSISVSFDEKAEEIIIPSWVSFIGQQAFSSFWHLRRLTLPAGVTEIGLEAFEHCHELQEFTWPPTLRVIGARAFCNCRALSRLVLPEGVRQIRGYAFHNCEGLEAAVLPRGVRELGAGVFAGCRNLRTVAIPSTVAKAGEGLLDRCTSLRHVYAYGCCPDVARQLPAGSTVFLHVDDPRALSPNRRTMARLAYLLDGRSLATDIGRDAAEGITRSAAAIVDLVMDEPGLLHAMLAARLIPARCLDVYHDAALSRGDPALIAALLHYQATAFAPEEIVRVRARREQDEERRMMRKFDLIDRRRNEHDLHGLVFAAAGRLRSHLTHSDLKQLLAQYGARLAPAVTPDTDYLIVGLHASEDSPKRKQAERLCVPELTEREFRIMLSRADPTGP